MQSDLNGDGTFAIKTKVDSIGWGDVIRIIVEDNVQAGKEMSQEIRQNAIDDSEKGNPMFDGHAAYCQISLIRLVLARSL